MATFLGLLELYKHLIEKPKILPKAYMTYSSVAREADEYGTKIPSNDGSAVCVFVSLEASNQGSQSIQIVSIYVRTKKQQLHQIKSLNLPTVLEPRSMMATRI